MYLEDYKVFRTFRTKVEMSEMASLLERHQIPSDVIENTHELIDTFYTGDQYQQPYQLLIPSALFIPAEKILKDTAEKNLANLPQDYYLFSFNNKELLEILAKPDEWGEIDAVLAQKLLRERGEDVSEKRVQALSNIRLETLREPDKENNSWVWLAYISTFFGGIFGIILGRIYWKSKKVLPNGEEVFRYSENKRTHGKLIYKIGWAFLIFWILVKAGLDLVSMSL